MDADSEKHVALEDCAGETPAPQKTQYFSDRLVSLFVEIRDNPIIRYGAPWKGTLGRRLFCIVLLVLPIAWAALAVLAEIFTALSWSTMLPCILSAVFFLVFVRDYRQKDLAEELLITRLSREQIAFGCLFWGVVMAVYPLLMAVIAGVIQIYLSATNKSPAAWGRTDYAANMITLGIWSLGTLLVGGGVMLASIVHGWIHGRRNRYVLIILCTVKVFIFILLQGFLRQAALRDFLGYGEANIFSGRAFTLLTSLAGCAAALWIGWRGARMWATAAFFAECDPVDFVHKHWLARERAARKFAKSAVAAGRRRFMAVWVRGLVPTLAYSTLGSATVFLAMSMLALAGRGFFAIVVCSFAGALFLFGQEEVRGRRTVVISGALRFPVLMRYVILVLPIVAILGFLLYMGNSAGYIDATFVGAVIMMGVFTLTFCLSMMPARGRGMKLRVGACVLGLFVVVSIGCAMTGIAGRNMALRISVMLYAASIVLINMLFAGHAGALMQRIHESEVIDHPVGMLSTDVPPPNVADVIEAAKA
ncbi:MAG: hypothetical protein ABI579_03130 [Candidatus Sumerlaeota bacterium]